MTRTVGIRADGAAAEATGEAAAEAKVEVEAGTEGAGETAAEAEAEAEGPEAEAEEAAALAAEEAAAPAEDEAAALGESLAGAQALTESTQDTPRPPPAPPPPAKIYGTGTAMKIATSQDFFVQHYRPCTDKSCRVSFRFDGCLDEVNIGRSWNPKVANESLRVQRAFAT